MSFIQEVIAWQRSIQWDPIYALYQSFYWSFAACILVGTIFALGVPIWVSARAFLPKLQTSLALIFALGHCQLILASWFFVKAGYSFYGAATFLLVATALILSSGLLFSRVAFVAGFRKLGNHLRASWIEIFAFVLYSILLAMLTSGWLTRNDLDLVTAGNTDVHHYARVAEFLLDRSGGSGNIVGIDLRAVARDDAFGAFTTLSLAALLLGRAPFDATIAPIVAGGALIAATVARLCRSVFRLPGAFAVVFGLLLLFNPLFLYLTLHYFLAQLLSAAMLLLFVSVLFSSMRSGSFTLSTALIACLASNCVILFTYRILFLPDILFSAALIGWLQFISRETSAWPRSLNSAANAGLTAIAFAALTTLGLLALSPYRVFNAVQTLFLSSANVGVPSWPLNLISPLMLMGIPAHWDWGQLLDTGSLFEFLGVAATVAASVFLLFRKRRSPSDTRARITLLGLSAFCFLGYFLVWKLYGHSYLQWKFAGSYTLIFGFAILACLIGVALEDAPLRLRRFAFYSSAAIVDILVIGSLAASAGPALYEPIHFPRQIKAISAIDEMPDVFGVYIDLENFDTRLLVANLIQKKPIMFSGVTYYYGYGGPLDVLQANAVLCEVTRSEHRRVIRDLGGGFLLVSPI